MCDIAKLQNWSQIWLFLAISLTTTTGLLFYI